MTQMVQMGTCFLMTMCNYAQFSSYNNYQERTPGKETVLAENTLARWHTPLSLPRVAPGVMAPDPFHSPS